MSQYSVDDRLRLELIRRTHPGIYIYFSLSMIFLFLVNGVTVDGNTLNLIAPVPLFLYAILAAQIFRFALHRFCEGDIRKPLRLYSAFRFLILLTPGLWGMAAGVTIYQQNLMSPLGVLFIMVSTGISCAVIHTLAPRPRTQQIYMVIIGLPSVVSSFAGKNGFMGEIIGVLYAMFSVYFIFVSLKLGRELRHAYETEDFLKNQQEKLLKVLNSVPGFVAVSDSQGRWVEFSQTFQALLHHAILQSIIKDFLASNLEAKTQELSWGESSEEKSYLVSLARIEDHGGGAILAAIPTTDLKNAQRQLEAQRSQAEYSARLATLGEMAAGIAHEINNPLTIIQGSAVILQRKIQKHFAQDETANRMCNTLISTTERIGRIIQGLRNFSRQGGNDPIEMTPLKKVIEESLDLCREKFIRNEVQLIVEALPEIQLPLRAVPISQVLINLLQNSYDAIKDLPEKIIRLRFEQSQEYLSIFVTDSGPGISTDQAKKIFQPFFTTKPVGQGTGLGLSISKGIIESHHGQLLLRTDRHQTTFEIRLPLASKSQAAKAA